MLQQRLHHCLAKRIEEISHARISRKSKLRHIPADHSDRTPRPPALLPDFDILLRLRRQLRMQLHPNHLTKGHLRSQQHRPAHPAPQVNKAVVHRMRLQRQPPPARAKLRQHRRRNPVIRRRMPVMPMPSLEIPPMHQPTRLNPIRNVKRMAQIAILLSQPRQTLLPSHLSINHE